MLMLPRTISRILSFLTLIFFFACQKSTESPEPPDDGVIKAVVLRTYGQLDAEFWPRLHSEWTRYGNKEISIDYSTFHEQPITYEELVSVQADVVIIDDANYGQSFLPYSGVEVADIRRYIYQGHGLIVTGGTFRRLEHQRLIPLLGFSTMISGNIHLDEPEKDSVEIIDGRHEVFGNLTSYTTGSGTIYATNDWDSDGNKGYPGDWQQVLTSPDAGIIGFVWNLNHLEGRPESSPISFIETEDYRGIFAGHTPAKGDSTEDDYQFYYNAIIYCSRE